MLFALGHGAAMSAPMTADTAAGQRPAPWVRLSERELVSGETRAGAPAEPDSLTFTQPNLFRPHEGGRVATDLGSWSESDHARLLDPSDTPGGNSALDSLRGFVNVAPATSGRRANAGAARDPRNDPLAGIDLGPEAREWVQDAFKGIVDSVLQLDVNERGRASFSILGMGDFGLSVSGDRSQIALTLGDDLLLLAQRSQPAAGGAGSGQPQAGLAADGTWRVAAHDETPLKKAVELVMEIAGHPLSMLVYLLLAAYALLWSVLTRQPRNSAHHLERQAAFQSAAAAPSRTRRRRHRVRRRR